MQLRCFTVSENRFTRFGCVKFWAMKIQLRNLFDKSICWSLVAVFSTSWWLYMRQVESNVRCCDSPNSRRHWKRADRRVPEEEQSYWCVEVAVIGDPYGMSIDMSASYLVLFNTLISSELKVEIRAGKSKSLIRWKRRKGGKRREKAGKGGKGGFGYAISLLAKIVSKRTTGHRVPHNSWTKSPTEVRRISKWPQEQGLSI